MKQGQLDSGSPLWPPSGCLQQPALFMGSHERLDSGTATSAWYHHGMSRIGVRGTTFHIIPGNGRCAQTVVNTQSNNSYGVWVMHWPIKSFSQFLPFCSTRGFRSGKDRFPGEASPRSHSWEMFCSTKSTQISKEEILWLSKSSENH